MSYKEKYKRYRLVVILCSIFIFFSFGLVGYFAGRGSEDYLSVAGIISLGIGAYIIGFIYWDKMREAKRWEIFDNFLEEPEYEKPPEDFMSEEYVETKAIAAWWKVNEEIHQN